jgi:hypothetical protein
MSYPEFKAKVDRLKFLREVTSDLWTVLRNFSQNKVMVNQGNLNTHLTKIAAFCRGKKDDYDRPIPFSDPQHIETKSQDIGVKMNCIVNFISVSCFEHANENM